LLRPAKLTLELFETAPQLDVTRPWIPERLVPLCGGASFAQLTPQQRLRYNHACARHLVDEFIWSERFLVLGPLKQLFRTSKLDADQSTVLQSFISDESHHVQSFSHLEELAVAADRGASKSMFNPPRWLHVLASLIRRYPKTLSFWAPVIEDFEQQTLKICKDYHRDDSIDPLFREVFLAHARDEARHCRFDVLLWKWLDAEGNAVTRQINRRLLASFISSYRSVEWGLDGPLLDLVRAHPELTDRFPALLAEAKALRRSNLLPAGAE
jgi:hypothetical protein